MTPERFKEVEALYHAARGRTAEDCAALLADADPDIPAVNQAKAEYAGLQQLL